MKQLRHLPPRLASLMTVFVLLAAIILPVIFASHAFAASAQLQSRTLSMSSSANGNITQDIAGNAIAAGAGGNGQKAKYSFSFKLKSTQSIGSVLIQFCDDPIPLAASCNTPTGLDAHNVSSVVSQSGWTGGALSLDTTTPLTGSPWNCAGTSNRGNCIALNRGSPGAETNTIDAAGGGVTPVTLVFGGTSGSYVTNPTSDNLQFYARITTYTDTAYTTKGDYGSVAAATAQQIDITAKVKEVLNFSVSATASTVPTATCVALDGTTNPDGLGAGGIKLGDTNGVLSFNQAYDAHSYFRISTNTNGGVKVYYSGDTLKNGSNSIAAIGNTETLSVVNSAQFGLAIDSSDTQGGNGYDFSDGMTSATNGNPSGSGNTTDYSQGAGAITNPGAVAKFAFDTASTTSPHILAYSNGPVACDTGSVRYLGNISTATPAGIYTTTITYIATGTY